MFGSCIKVLALIEATSVTGLAKNLVDFAKRARDCSDGLSDQASVETAIVTFRRGRGGAFSSRISHGFDRLAAEGELSPFIRGTRDAGIEVHVLSERFRFDPRVVIELKDLVERARPDILQTHNVKSHFLLRLSGLGREYPWVAFHHGYTATD